MPTPSPDHKHGNGRHALATRYDKLAVTYRGGAVLAAILVWLRGKGDAS